LQLTYEARSGPGIAVKQPLMMGRSGLWSRIMVIRMNYSEKPGSRPYPVSMCPATIWKITPGTPSRG